MRVAIVGAGAVGGLIGTRLAAAGVPTSALARGETLEALRTKGWRLRNGDELVTAPARASADANELGPQDVVIVSLKTQALSSVAASIAPLLGPETIVLPMMNGVPWWFFQHLDGPHRGLTLASVDPDGTIGRAIEPRRVIGGVVHLAASRSEPGLFVQARFNELIVGEPDHSASARVQEVGEMLMAAGLKTAVSSNIHGDIWYKLWGNLTINPIAALTGATADAILDDDLVRTLCNDAMAEAQRIGERIGCPIDETPVDRNAVTRKLGAFRPSMLQDADAGRALELDALVGAVREIGQIVDVPTPNINALFGLTRLSARARHLGE
jgi:2-dehydropantoate 2-reductase